MDRAHKSVNISSNLPSRTYLPSHVFSLFALLMFVMIAMLGGGAAACRVMACTNYVCLLKYMALKTTVRAEQKWLPHLCRTVRSA
jgi:hypothetical protein